MRNGKSWKPENFETIWPLFDVAKETTRIPCGNPAVANPPFTLTEADDFDGVERCSRHVYVLSRAAQHRANDDRATPPVAGCVYLTTGIPGGEPLRGLWSQNHKNGGARQCGRL
jgi:hypothetical protein